MKIITKRELTEFIKDCVSNECDMPRDQIDVHTEFINFNMDSVKAVVIMDHLEKFMGVELSPLYFWDNPTIDSLTSFLIDNVLKIK
jgi:acyl carrier protein